MDVDTRAPSLASDIIEDTADYPWVSPAPPQPSSERERPDVTCNTESAVPARRPVHSHVRADYVANSSTSIPQRSSDSSMTTNVVGRHQSHSFPGTSFNALGAPARDPSPQNNTGGEQALEVEVRYLRSRLKDLEVLSARLHGQLESSQQRLFKERAHHETIKEMLATRVGVLEGDNQQLRARLGEKAPEVEASAGAPGHRTMATASPGPIRRKSRECGKKRSPSCDPRAGMPPRLGDSEAPTTTVLRSASAPNAIRRRA